MYLFEFDQDSAQVAKIVALTSQLKDDVDTGQINPDEYTLEDLLQYFQEYDIILDKTDLYNMIKVNPLKSVISNIQGDKVVFNGHDSAPDSEEQPEDDGKKTVAKMAQSAMKK
jgi:hypothetical protein